MPDGVSLPYYPHYPSCNTLPPAITVIVESSNQNHKKLILNQPTTCFRGERFETVHEVNCMVTLFYGQLQNYLLKHAFLIRKSS